jgi:hypothetical protein
MDALKDINPETRISDLTVEQFEAVMTRTFCRVADFAAVRFAQEQMYAKYAPVPFGLIESVAYERADNAVKMNDKIAGEDWPRNRIPRTKPKQNQPSESLGQSDTGNGKTPA